MKTNKHSIFFTLALCLVLLTSCVSSKKFHSSDIIEITSFHNQMAILPIEGLSPKLALEYQKNVHNALLSKSRQTVKISVQKISKTNQILAGKNVSRKMALSMKPQKLATLLGVDAVLKVRVGSEGPFEQKMPEISFDESGEHWSRGMEHISEGILPSVKITASMFDTETGEMFWEYGFVRKLKSIPISKKDFEDTSLKIAKNLPYKWE